MVQVLALILLILLLICLYNIYNNIIRLKKYNPQTTSMMKYRKKHYGFDYTPITSIIPIQSIQQNIKDNILNLEDSDFYNHKGFNFKLFIKHFKENIKRKRYWGGGSTITQQVARTLFLSAHRSIFRKISEIIIALLMEIFLSKERILELYINYYEVGEGIYGFNQLAQKSGYNFESAPEIIQKEIIYSVALYSPDKSRLHFYNQGFYFYCIELITYIINLPRIVYNQMNKKQEYLLLFIPDDFMQLVVFSFDYIYNICIFFKNIFLKEKKEYKTIKFNYSHFVKIKNNQIIHGYNNKIYCKNIDEYLLELIYNFNIKKTKYCLFKI